MTTKRNRGTLSRRNVIAKCRNCGRRYQSHLSDAAVEVGGIGVCPDCWERAGWENEHSDRDHRTKPDPDCPICQEAKAKAATAPEIETDVKVGCRMLWNDGRDSHRLAVEGVYVDSIGRVCVTVAGYVNGRSERLEFVRNELTHRKDCPNHAPEPAPQLKIGALADRYHDEALAEDAARNGEPPAVTLLERTSWSSRYRLEGGTLAPDWAKSLRPGKVAWCEITVHDDGRHIVSGFGGEVWPAAWPALFTVPANLGALEALRVTARGIELLAKASHAAAGRALGNAIAPTGGRFAVVCPACGVTVETTDDPELAREIARQARHAEIPEDLQPYDLQPYVHDRAEADGEAEAAERRAYGRPRP